VELKAPARGAQPWSLSLLFPWQSGTYTRRFKFQSNKNKNKKREAGLLDIAVLMETLMKTPMGLR